MSRLKRIVFFFLLVIVASETIGQIPAEEFEAIKKLYPDKSYAYTKYFWKIKLELKRGEVIGEMSREEERMCLQESEIRFTEGSFSYSSFSELEDFEAITKTPGEKKYDEYKVDDYIEYDLANSDVFHDDQKTIKFHWPHLEVGAKQCEYVTLSYNDPHFLPSLYSSVYIPIIHGRFQIEVEEGIDLELMPMNIDTLHADYSEETKGKFTTYTWEFKNYDGLKRERDAVHIIRFVPHVLLRVKSYESKEGPIKVFGTVSDLHDWYCEFFENSRDQELDEIKQLVDSLTSDATSDLEAARSIYRWVQKNIEYIAIEDGLNGFQPAKASTVCSSRFGDCKGMSNLLHTMYEVYGLPSQLTWIGTRDIAYTYDEVPTPNTDNHMILTVIINGERHFLDPTHNLLSFGVPSPMIQGKQALISYNCDSFELAFVPIIEAEANVLSDSSEISISGDSIVGHGVATMTGFSRMFFAQALYKSDYDYLKKFARAYLSRGSNRFVLDTVWLENIDDIEKPLKVYYEFHIGGYVMTNKDERYLNMNLDMEFDMEAIDEDREFPVLLEFRTIVKSHTVLNLDDDTRIEKLPEEQEGSGELYAYRIKYERDGNRIIRESYDKLDFIELTSDHFDEWNEYHNSFSRAKRESLILTSNE